MEKEVPQRERETVKGNSTGYNRSKSNNKETKPSADWRKGDCVVFKKKKEKVRDVETASMNSDIYPKWWGVKVPQPNKEELDKQYSDRKYSTNENVMEERKTAKKGGKKKTKRSTNDEQIRKFVDPVYREVPSKIKDQVERDKKLYNVLKQNNPKQNNRQEYNYPRKNKNENVKTILTSDYKIEYDRNLKPQAIREKSIERKVPLNQPKQKNVSIQEKKHVEMKPKMSENVNYDSDNNNIMSETEGGLSSYAPSERTKNFFVNQFKRGDSDDKSSVLSNSLNYSDDNDANKVNKKQYKKEVNFNNYMNIK